MNGADRKNNNYNRYLWDKKKNKGNKLKVQTKKAKTKDLYIGYNKTSWSETLCYFANYKKKHAIWMTLMFSGFSNFFCNSSFCKYLLKNIGKTLKKIAELVLSFLSFGYYSNM